MPGPIIFSVPISPGALSYADGGAPTVVAYNENHDRIGSSCHNDYIESGSFLDLTAYQDEGNGQQPTTLQARGTDDELCIAYIAQTWPDGTSRGWLGDMGRRVTGTGITPTSLSEKMTTNLVRQHMISLHMCRRPGIKSLTRGF